MICPNCGKEIGDAKFCPECGLSIAQPARATVPPGNSDPQNINVTVTKKKKPITKRWWFWVLVVLVIGGVFSRGGSSSSKSETASTSTTKTESSSTSSPANTSTQKKSEISYEITDVVNVIEDSSYGDGKRYTVIIEVTNTGDIPIYLEKCVLDFEDNNGHLLQTDDFLSKVPDIAQPGERGYFYTNGSSSFDDNVDFSNGCNLIPSLTIEKAKRELKSHEVIDTSLYPSYGAVGIKGRIVNETDKDISLIYVTTVFYDSNGKVLGISGTNVTDIKANSKTSFDDSGIFMKDFSVNDVADYRVYADEMYMQF